MRALFLGLAFVLELAALAGLAVVGAHAGGVVLAIVLPVAAALLWGLFAAPKARYDSPPAKVTTRVLVFGGAAAGLIASGHVVPGVVLAVLVIIDDVALALLRES